MEEASQAKRSQLQIASICEEYSQAKYAVVFPIQLDEQSVVFDKYCASP